MKHLLLVLGVMFLLFSCHNNEDEDVPQTSNFYALTVGNSWVYKSFKYNLQTEIYDESGVIDSISIVGTENIQGNIYYKLRVLTTGNENNNPIYFNENGEHFYFRREDNGKLMTESGYVGFTNNNYEERELRSNLNFTFYEQLQHEIREITTDAGTFNCIYSKKYARNSVNNEIYPGIDEVNYADGIGIIEDSNSFLGLEKPIVKRYLVSYNVQ